MRLEAFVEVFTARASYDIDEHAHAFAEVLVILAGRSRVVVGDRAWDAGPGDVVLFQPGLRHRERVHAGTVHQLVLRFDARLLRGVRLPPRGSPPVLRLPWPDEVARVARRIHEETRLEDPWSRVVAQACLVQLAAMLRRAAAAGTRSGTGRHAARQLVADIDGLPSGRVPAPARSRALRAEFRALTGVSPKRYQVRERALRAQRLLRDGDEPIAAIATRLGFASPQYFIRRFKADCGSTPAAYRRAARGS